MARGEGFGRIVGQGIRRMKERFAREYGLDQRAIAHMDDIGMESKGLEYSEYVTKESLAMQGGYGLTLKGPPPIAPRDAGLDANKFPVGLRLDALTLRSPLGLTPARAQP